MRPKLIMVGPSPAVLCSGVLGGLLALAGLGTDGHAAIQQNGTYVPGAVNRVPDGSQRDRMQGQENEDRRIQAANAERKKQISEDSEKLLKMASDLKDELDKTNKDTLSVDAIHKIDAIQKLAHEMKDKLRLRTE